jgi:hypothetical protein
MFRHYTFQSISNTVTLHYIHVLNYSCFICGLLMFPGIQLIIWFTEKKPWKNEMLETAFGVFKLLWHTQQLIEIYKTIENDYLNRLCWLIEWCCLESIRYRQTLDTFQHFIFSRFFFCESYDQLNSWKH